MKQYLLVLLFFIGFCAFSQNLEGIVFDQNKNPLSGVSVYLDGTTLGTSTDENGKYIIYNNSKINTNLVFRFIGFETFYVNNPFENNFQKIVLQPKTESLEEVVISNEVMSRATKLEIFREVFLGTTKGGLACKILNEDDIILRFNSKTKVLKATSKKPLIIENDYLAYKVLFDIHQFEAELLSHNNDFNFKGRKGYPIKRSIYLGTTSYTDLSKNDKIKTIRNEVYKGSPTHFFRNLTNNLWNKKEFLLFKGSYQTNPDFHFKIEDEADFKKVTVLYNQKDEVLMTKPSSFYATFSLLFNKSEQSKITFYKDIFFVDQYGNTSIVGDIEYGGVFSSKKVGDMLPMDFVPLKD